MGRALAVLSALLAFTLGVAAFGWAQEDDARWRIGDTASYALAAPAGGLGQVTFVVGVPTWQLDADGAFAWAVPLHMTWNGPAGDITRTTWFADAARPIYETLEGSMSGPTGASWIDGAWVATAMCPFAPDCRGEPWPEQWSADLSAWFGSAGPRGAQHTLTRSDVSWGPTPWTPRASSYSLPPLPVVAATPWGPDDATAADAYAAFASDPEVAPILEAGYVGAVWKHPMVAMDGGAAAAWQFVATDGHRVVERFVEPSLLDPLGAGYVVVTRAETRVEPASVPDRFPAAGSATWPSLAAVEQRAAQMPARLHPALDTERWGAWVACTTPSCQEVEARLAVVQGPATDGSRLVVDSQGRMMSWHERSPAPLAAVLVPETTAQAPGGWVWPDPATTAAVGAASLAVAALTWAATNTKGLLAGFTRLRRDTILDHPNREALWEAIKAEPGIHLKQLERRLDLAGSTVRYHAGRLEEHGLIRSKRTGNRVAVWAVEHAMQPHEMWSEERQAVWRAVQAGARTMQDLAAATGRSRGTLIHHINAMEAEGAVRRSRVGRAVHVEVAA